MMELDKLRALYDQEMRINIEIPGMLKDRLPGLVRFTRPGGGMNMVLYSRLQEDGLDEVIQQQIDYFKPLGQPFEWTVYEHDHPANLVERLARHGFEPGEAGPNLVLDLSDPPPNLLAPVKADIRRVETADDLEVVIGIMTSVWGGDYSWMRSRIGGHFAIPGHLSMYLAYVDGKPASAAWIYFHSGSRFGGLFGGSTLPEYRGNGLYTSLLARRAQEAIQRGCQYLVINASDMSRPIVEKHGFHLLAMSIDCEYVG